MNYTKMHLQDTKFLDAILKDCIFYMNGGYASHEALSRLGMAFVVAPAVGRWSRGRASIHNERRVTKASLAASGH